MPPRDKMLLVVTAFGMILATLAPEFIYQRMIFPRLPTILYVPMLWWIAMLSPLALVPFLLGLPLLSGRSVPAHSLVAVVGPAVIEIVRSFSTGASHAFHGHDMPPQGAPEMVAEFVVWIAIAWILFTSFMFLGHVIGTSFRESRTKRLR